MNTQKKNKIWSNTYKTRLWLGSLDHDTFNDRQKREWDYFAGWGPKGCGDHNYILADEFHVSIPTITRDISHMKKHVMIEVKGARWKHRRIIALPWPTKAAWQAESLKQNISKLARNMKQSTRDLARKSFQNPENKFIKNDELQRRTRRHSINAQKNSQPNSELAASVEVESKPSVLTCQSPQTPVGSKVSGTTPDEKKSPTPASEVGDVFSSELKGDESMYPDGKPKATRPSPDVEIDFKMTRAQENDRRRQLLDQLEPLIDPKKKKSPLEKALEKNPIIKR